MKWKQLLISCLSTLHFVASDPHCGYEACPKIDKEMLTVHLVPHTHDDVGWVKTVDEYFFGTNQRPSVSVKTIIESVIEQLQIDPGRKFIWVETAFFWKWWSSQQNDTLKDVVKKLVSAGQLEFTGGAWSMNDEAVTHYQSTIDQFTWGFRRLNDIFGDCGRPHVGWQIDPFGHSRETASLMAQIGFDGLFFGRLDKDDKKNRMDHKSMEMIWRGSKNIGEDGDLFTGVLYNHYSPPRGFCFDVWCSDYISDEPGNSNYKEKIASFVQLAKEQSDKYLTKNIMWTMGMDFHYMIAGKWYKNMDTLIKHVNSISNETGIVAVYSTPSCYLQALHNSRLAWPTKDDDFFPYASEPDAYWTGFFTSRPNLKRFERAGNNLLQVCKQLHVLAGSTETDGLNSLREAMGVLQHHDAITGTEKQHVAEDYAAILNKALVQCDGLTSEFLNKLSRKREKEPSLVLFERCPLLNMSDCAVSENKTTFVVKIFNPLARRVSKFVRLPVTGPEHSVFDLSSGKKLDIQYVPIMDEVNKIPVGKGKALFELIFEASDLPPVGFKSFHVTKTGRQELLRKLNNLEHEIGNEFVKVSFDDRSNLIRSVTVEGKNTPIRQRMLYYQSGKSGYDDAGYQGTRQASGAYIFRPRKNQPFKVSNEPTKISIFKGPLVQEAHQTFSPWASQVVRVYRGQKHVEIDWLVGPIPTADGFGKEVISKISTNLKTNGEFTTDSNSREYLRRRRNVRETWTANIEEPVAGNYYPVTSAISMQDEISTVAILTDRAQGGASIEDGSLELMLHRRLVQDDGFGVEEVLNEQQMGVGMVARGRHILLIAPVDSNVTARQRDLVQREMVLEPTLYFAPTNLTAQEWAEKYLVEFSGIKTALPENVNLLTMEPWRGNSVLLRLENAFEKKEDQFPVKVSLTDLFEAEVVSVEEMMLGANQKVGDSKRFKWQAQFEGIGDREGPARKTVGPSNNFEVILYPMQIRTFVVSLKTTSV
ncbi:lysosomal alpha-mannosidase-like isoform X2 [Cloeon dipterum]|uniref:lysosomal alpha-mannosidase-like isoform X2 n=1 Tax=Cloeon dipterum TaxID=197152 RepID=UPI00321FD88D